MLEQTHHPTYIIPKGLRVLFLSGLFSFLKHPVFHFHRKSFGIGAFPSLNKPSEETEMLGGRPWNNAMTMAAHSTGSVTVTSMMKVTLGELLSSSLPKTTRWFRSDEGAFLTSRRWHSLWKESPMITFSLSCYSSWHHHCGNQDLWLMTASEIRADWLGRSEVSFWLLLTFQCPWILSLYMGERALTSVLVNVSQSKVLCFVMSLCHLYQGKYSPPLKDNPNVTSTKILPR